MKTVGIKDLKNNLSAYLREVRSGTRIFVSDRKTVIAELHEPGAVYSTTEGDNLVLSEWAADGSLRMPSRAKRPLPESPVTAPAGTADRLLRDDRGD